MPSRTVVIRNQQGLHARPASQLVTLAWRFKADVYLSKLKADGGEPFEVNGKSVLGVLLLEGGPGSHLVVRTEGEDADQALEALVSLVESGFGEE